jgi:hypothetical protein
MKLFTCQHHSLSEALLEPAILAAVALLLVDLAVTVGDARVHALVLKFGTGGIVSASK